MLINDKIINFNTNKQWKTKKNHIHSTVFTINGHQKIYVALLNMILQCCDLHKTLYKNLNIFLFISTTTYDAVPHCMRFDRVRSSVCQIVPSLSSFHTSYICSKWMNTFTHVYNCIEASWSYKTIKVFCFFALVYVVFNGLLARMYLWNAIICLLWLLI